MTNLIRFSPNTDMRRMQREFDTLFNSFFPATRTESSEAETAVWTPRIDLAETDDAYLIHLDLPGLSKEDINLNYHDGTLSVSGERKVNEQEDKANYVRIERFYGHFYRSFALPKAINQNDIEATYQDGVLDIRVPKTEEVKPRQIKVS